MTEKGFFLYTDETIQEDVPRDVIHVKIDASVEVIDDQSFKNCKQLQTVDFSDATRLVMISEEAFAGCESLKEADLTCLSELRFIYHRAFQGCISLQNVGKLPARLDRIGEHAFDPGQNFMEVGKLDLDFSTAEALKFIYRGAFANCMFEKVIKLPACVEAIAEKAFEASSMPGIDFSSAESLRFIGRAAFEHSRIESPVQFPFMLETIDDNAFCGSTVPHIDFSMAESLQRIGVSAFSNCKFENEVRLPARLEQLSEEAFSGSSMQRLDLSDAIGLKIIDRWSFARCTIEKDVKFSSTLEGISQRSFTGSSMQKLDFSMAESLRVIGHGSFMECNIEEEVTLPKGLEEIWPRAFAQARTSSVNLSMLKDTVKQNSFKAFDGCIYGQMIVDPNEESSTTEDAIQRGLEAAEQVSAAEDSEEVTKPRKYVKIDGIMKLNPEWEEKAPESPDIQEAAPPSTSNGSILVKNSGWLEKKSRKKNMFLQPVWERRYFILEDGVLSYSRRKEGTKTKSLSNVMVRRNGIYYEVRDRNTSKLLTVLRLPSQGSTWDPKHPGKASTSELELEDTENTTEHEEVLEALTLEPHRSASVNSLRSSSFNSLRSASFSSLARVLKLKT